MNDTNTNKTEGAIIHKGTFEQIIKTKEVWMIVLDTVLYVLPAPRLPKKVHDALYGLIGEQVEVTAFRDKGSLWFVYGDDQFLNIKSPRTIKRLGILDR